MMQQDTGAQGGFAWGYLYCVLTPVSGAAQANLFSRDSFSSCKTKKLNLAGGLFGGFKVIIMWGVYTYMNGWTLNHCSRAPVRSLSSSSSPPLPSAGVYLLVGHSFTPWTLFEKEIWEDTIEFKGHAGLVMAQQVKALAAEAEDLSSTPGHTW